MAATLAPEHTALVNQYIVPAPHFGTMRYLVEWTEDGEPKCGGYFESRGEAVAFVEQNLLD